MNNEHQCREYEVGASDSNKCAGSVRQYESGSLNVALCDYHYADLQDRMYAGSMR